MKLGIVGGALQGMEAVYLAHHAGYETLVLDRRKDAPAASMSDAFLNLDPAKDPKAAKKALEDCDAVIPACENVGLLEALCGILSGSETDLLFDMDAYRISSSKESSNRMMSEMGIPIPLDWPACGYPAVVKPSSQSGSVGVTIARSEKEVRDGIERIRAMNDVPIVQEFVSGKGLSVEVIGGERPRSFATTEIVLGPDYDCKMVRCSPNTASEAISAEMGALSEKLSKHMGLKALMDLEAIATPRGLRVLEIDARIPSQTPAAVLAATGVNILEELVSGTGRKGKKRSSAYEHIHVRDGVLTTCGEKNFSKVSKPYLARGLFGTDEMITDYGPDKKEWRATMINSGRSEEEVEEKRRAAVRKILEGCGLERYSDPLPEVL